MPLSNDELNTTDKGRCLCGAITFIVAGKPIYNVVCHCLNCKRTGGSTFHTASIFDASQYTLLTGAEKRSTYEDFDTQSGKALLREFCSVCGSGTAARTTLNSNIVSIPAGVLETAGLDWKPDKEQFMKDRADWLSEFEAIAESKKTAWGPTAEGAARIS